VREFVSSFFGETSREDGDGMSEAGSGGRSTLDSAIETISTSLERWRSTGGLLRFTELTRRDHIVGEDVTVDLAVGLGPLARLGAVRARVRLGTEVIGEVAIEGPQVHVRGRSRSPGIYAVTVDVLDAQGRVVGWGKGEEVPIVHVVGDSPTVAVDAQLLLGDVSGRRDLSALHELCERGWVLMFFDLHPVDRQQELREALKEHGLPRSAILVHPASSIEFKTLGIDFHELFIATGVRRIHADGVPLLMVSAESLAWTEACEGQGISSIDLRDLEEHLRRPDGLDPWEAQAAEFARLFAAADRLTWRLDILGGSRCSDGNQCHVELDNRRARERLFALIDGAHSSVHLQFYILRAGDFTERLAVRLIRRARAGVEVRLIVDALYSTQDVLGLTNPIVVGLSKEPGIEIVAASPINRGEGLVVGAFKRRNHRKVIVIDGEVALVGGRNCGDEYYTGFDEVAITDWTPHERVPWLDAHVEIRGPLTLAVQRAFVDTWRRSSGCAIADEARLFPPAIGRGTTSARLVLHEGLVDTNTLGVYRAMIDSAQQHVYILNDFPIVASLCDALLRALARGVRVEILTGCAVARRGDGEMLQGPQHRVLFEHMTKKRLEPLIRAGVRAYEYATPQLPEIVVRGGIIRPYVHAKVMTVDGRIASVGSANLDVTASYWEDEANIVVEDEALVTGLEATIDELIAGSYRIDLSSAYWRREVRQRELVSALWPETLYS